MNCLKKVWSETSELKREKVGQWQDGLHTWGPVQKEDMGPIVQKLRISIQ